MTEESLERMCVLADRIAHFVGELVRLLPAHEPNGDGEASSESRSIRKAAEVLCQLRDQLRAVPERCAPDDLTIAVWDRQEDHRRPRFLLRQSWDPSSKRHRFVDVPAGLDFLVERIERQQASDSSPQGIVEYAWSEVPDGVSVCEPRDHDPPTDDYPPGDPDGGA